MKKIIKYEAEYASEVMSEIPPGYIDKTICGCGLTTVALENDVDTIIAVPTIYLALNKSEQYPNERYKGKVLAVWGDTRQEEILSYKAANTNLKIMVTYDSINKVKFLLERCKLVIDESNELLPKTKLKPKVIENIFEIAKEFKETVSFISATPTPLPYMPDWVSGIDQIKIEWSNTAKANPILCERTYPYKSLKEELITTLEQKDSMTIHGKTFSKVIVFINSVQQIARVVKDCNLDKSKCGIICGDSISNDIKTRGINRYVNGKMPKYLFITSSGFSGIDLSDPDAMTVVVSTTKRRWQMIDMLTDLKQAVSRQRNKSNPNYGTFIYIYNQTMFDKSQEELLEEIDKIYSKISKTIKMYDWTVETDNTEGFEPYPDFLAYSLYKDGRYYINEQAFSADKYFILETREQYTKGFDIREKFDSTQEIEAVEIPRDVTFSMYVDRFKAFNIDGKFGEYSLATKTEWITLIELSYKMYKNVWKDYTYTKQMVENYRDTFNVVKVMAGKRFSTGKRYTRKIAKQQLQAIYDLNDIVRKAKHGDFDNIFKTVKHITINGERFIEILEK